MCNEVTFNHLQKEKWKLFFGVFDLFLQVLDIWSWHVGNIPHNAHRWIKKDENLQTFIHHPMCAS
jgi:hypothetical protein